MGEQPPPDEQPIEVDHVIIVCKGCKGERTIYPDRPLRGADEVIEWIRTKPTSCGCGATHCDLKMHMRGSAAADAKEPKR